jgi:hypothetical protein
MKEKRSADSTQASKRLRHAGISISIIDIFLKAFSATGFLMLGLPENNLKLMREEFVDKKSCKD